MLTSSFVLSPAEMRILEGLRLNPRGSFPGRVRGERLTRRKGISIEFADYREYSEGDDLRHLDWNVLARLETPIMKTYRDEEDLAVHLLLDASPSMEFGEPTKLSAAVRLAAAMGLIGLAGGDAVYPRNLGRREAPSAPLRGRASSMRLMTWASSMAGGESRALAESLREFANSSARAGLVIVFSDGLDPDAPTALRMLRGRGHEVFFLQVLSDIELDPDLEGDLRLLDAETGAPVEITANGMALADYRRRLTEHNQAIADTMLRIGGRYALVRPGDSVSEIARDVWKREGWVRT